MSKIFYLNAYHLMLNAIIYENPSIGIIICKEKSKTVVEYALKDTNQPIGVATYKVSKKLPKEMEKYLPSSKQIIEKLEYFLKEK